MAAGQPTTDLLRMLSKFIVLWKMASRGELEPSPALIEGVQTSSLDGEDEESMEIKLRRIQLAHEGMRLLLCSQVKQPEELFRTSSLSIACTFIFHMQ